MRRRFSSALFLGLLLFSGCAGKELITSPDEASPKFSGTSYYQAGRELFFDVEVRPARIGGPRSMLPLYLTIVRLQGDTPIHFGRESFVLELPDHTRVPLADYDEFRRDYDRSQVDRRSLGNFLETLQGKFPEPPYSWLPLDFFPPRGSNTFPRESVDLRAQQLTHGFLYFRLPDNPPLDARYNLLITPQGGETTYLVDFPPFKDDKRR